MGGTQFVETLIQDLRYGLRQLRRNPGFTAAAVAILALGIGANTAMFTVVRAVLLKPLPYANPDRVVRITRGHTLAHFKEMKAAARSYSEIGAFAGGMENVTLSGGAKPEALTGARVSANFLRILGIHPLLGRSFLPQENKPGGPQVAMISAELWRRRFGGDPRIAGKTVTFNLKPYTIIGVLPPGFAFPFPAVDVWLTKPSEWSVIPAQGRPLSPILGVFGRLRSGVSLQQANAELAVLNHQYAVRHPQMLDAKPNPPERVMPLKSELVSSVRSMLWLLFGAVGFVLLIACANVASLLLARAAFRSREFVVRAALGAGRGRLVRQLLVESIILAFAGGLLGVMLAKWSLSGITSMRPLQLPRMGEIRLDGWVLAFAVVISIATGIFFGLFPSLRASRPDLAGALREHGGGTALGSVRRGLPGLSARSLLVVGQVALSMVLLIGATLMIESLVRLEGVNPGFESAHLLTMHIALAPAKYDTIQKKATFFDQIVQRVDSAPGVSSAAVTWTLPMTGWAGSPVEVVELPPVRFNERPIAILQSVTPGYFRTLRIPLERGREFTAHDITGAVPVAIISESMARRFWPSYPNGEDPIGQHILVGATWAPVEIVGIVADVHQAGLDVGSRPELYAPCAQRPPQSAMLAVRTKGDPLQFVNVVWRRILAIDPDQPVSAVQTMDDVVDASVGQRRLIMLLLGGFAGVALLLATVGIYGVISYSAAQRTRETGIRMALGARQSDILRLVVGQGVRLALVGVACGLGAAAALTRVMTALLFHTDAVDPVTFAGTALLFILVAALASYIPARRAARVEPMTALRHE